MSKQKTDLRILLKKYLNKEKIFKYEEDDLFKKLVEKADITVGNYIKKRDEKDWWVLCVTNRLDRCMKKVRYGSSECQCCHWIPRAYFSHRRDYNNLAWWCTCCNYFNQEEHKTEYTVIQTKNFWKARVEKQRYSKNMKKPSIDLLLEIIEKAKKDYETLINNW